jgi:signal transduction histidine kinase
VIRQHNIQQQVALLTLIPLLILTVCLEFFLLHGRFSDLDSGLIERGKLIARQMASSSEYGVFSNNQSFLSTLANGVLREHDVRGLVILNAAADVLLSAGEISTTMQELSSNARATQIGLSGNHAQLRRAGQVVSQDGQGVGLQIPVKMDSRSVWIYQPIVPAQVSVDDLDFRPPAQQIGAVIIEMSKVNTEKYKREMLIVTLVGTALFLLTSLYLVYLASRSITIPTRQLSVAVQQIAQGDLSTRITFTTKVAELATLAQGLNEMTSQLQQDREILQQRIEQATQALREKKEEAERSSHDKSRFLAVASHDLRQPLHALGLYVAELRRQLSLTPQQHLVEQVEQSVDALATLLNALLDISKLDAGAVIPQKQSCNIAAMVTRVASDYQMLATIRNIHLVVRPCKGNVTSDPVLLERILMNLVSNAIRYSYPNGCVMIACRKRGNQMRIEVRDNGIGISQTDQADIFREFFQVSKPQLDSSKGQGLGLAIVDRLVKLLGHGIELRSAPNQGSLFALQVPISAEPENFSSTDTYPVFHASSPEGRESSPLTGKRILVVDDDELVLSGTATILTSWGGTVFTATCLQDVHQLLVNDEWWDLIISDYQLGVNETGFDVIAAVRARQEKNIPGILISGDTSPELLLSASSGGHHLLHKPVRPAKLRSLAVFLLNDPESQII